ncbi:MAG: hypothetical protein L0J45_07755 [Psychroflexus sp.]|nr:hypothetical protein [Psychroflexus sp.]MDN6309041.1 hypothetical protein [Psychroflexus sp.]
MRAILVLFLLFFLSSCQNLEKQNADQILKLEKQQINWKEVDIYPSFKACDEALNRDESYECFTSTIASYLDLDNCLSTQFKNVSACYQLHLSVLKTGEIRFDSIGSSVTSDNEKLSKQIESCVRKLEPIYPAQKRSVPVDLNFEIPLHFK